VADVLANYPGVVGGLAGAVGVALLLLTVRCRAAVEGGARVLAYGRPLKGLVVVFWVFWAGLVSLLVARPGDDPDPLSAAALVAGFFALTLALHLESFFVRVAFDESGINTRSPWRAGRHIPWSDVRRVWYSPGLQWYVVDAGRHGRVRLHDFLGGVGSLLTELRRRGIPVEGA
jgi:hypothetical protein